GGGHGRLRASAGEPETQRAAGTRAAERGGRETLTGGLEAARERYGGTGVSRTRPAAGRRQGLRTGQSYRYEPLASADPAQKARTAFEGLSGPELTWTWRVSHHTRPIDRTTISAGPPRRPERGCRSTRRGRIPPAPMP